MNVPRNKFLRQYLLYEKEKRNLKNKNSLFEYFEYSKIKCKKRIKIILKTIFKKLEKILHKRRVQFFAKLFSK